jgi:histidinol dehydrogenase
MSLAFAGALGELSRERRARLLDRGTQDDAALQASVETIVRRVRADGDDALRALARELDGVTLAALEVPRVRWHRAAGGLTPGVRGALERAAANITAVHRAFLPPALTAAEPEPGIRVTRRADPLARVGVYAPGGRAAYPSSVLMGAVPARVAGVGEVILCSPPSAEDGVPSDVVLAAALIAGVDRVFAVGGAGAIAAMACGTATIPRVDRIVGPGNAWVAEAKRQVSGTVGIDSPAGPSELLVIADADADPARVAAELVAQAEHDPRACAVAVAVSRAAAERVLAALGEAVAGADRTEVIRASLATRGAVLWTDTVDEAVVFANDYAPEHLLLAVTDAAAVAPAVRSAGTVFLGERTSAAFGDYLTGANHVLPTGGLARSFSGLGVDDFLRWTTLQEVTPAAARALAADVAALAEAEGLPGHAIAARRALEEA